MKRMADQSDDEYQPQPQEGNKKKTTRKSNMKEKYVFTEEDHDILKKGILQHGRGCALIAKEYFSNRTPAVSGQDIRNYINRTENIKLKNLMSSGKFSKQIEL